MTKIAAVETFPIEIPYRHPVIWAEGRLESGDHVLVRLTTDDGTRVWTEAIPRTGLYGETQATLLAVIGDLLAPRVIGHDLWSGDISRLLRTGIANNHVAVGAVEEAVYLARARSAGLALRDLLGGGPAQVPVTWMVMLGELDQMLAEAREHHGRGYRSFKIKGGVDADADIELYRRLAEVLDDSDVYIDANQGYDWTDALRVARELAPYGLRILEEPLPVAHPLRRELALRTGVGILGDDSVKTLADGVRELRDGSIQALSIKLPRTGVRDSMRLAGIAAAFGVPVSMGSQGESALGTFVNAQIASAMAADGLRGTELTHFEVFTGQVTTREPVVTNGLLAVEDPVWDDLVTEDSIAPFATGR